MICAVCQTKSPASAVTCPACGEASWVADEADSEAPKPAAKPSKAPKGEA